MKTKSKSKFNILYSHSLFVIRYSLFFLIILLGFFGLAGRSQAATLEVGAGKTYSTIQAAVNVAQPGDTVLVYDGTYYEDIDSVRAGASDNYITIQSKNYLGAIVDAQNTRKYCFWIKHSYIKIIGFDCRNAVIDTTYYLNGAIIIYAGTWGVQVLGTEISWNKMSGCNSSLNEGAILTLVYANNTVIRGNKFLNNTYGIAYDQSTVHSAYSSDLLLEFNSCEDPGGNMYDRGLYYDFHLSTYANNSIVRYNKLTWGNKLRDSVKFQVYHNYVEKGYFLFWDDEAGAGGAQIEYHNVHNNTIKDNNIYGLLLGNCDYSTFEKNLFVGCATVWDALTTNYNDYNKFIDNHRDNSGAGDDLGTGNTETNTTISDSGLDTVTKCNILIDRGSDLDVSKWPFTHCDGSPYINFPYTFDNIAPPPPDTTPPAAPTGVAVN